jgi:hypothetical protein
LVYNYFRNFDSTVGRFIQSDWIGLAGGINTYAYAGSRPSISRDRLGLDFDDCVTLASVTIPGGTTEYPVGPPSYSQWKSYYSFEDGSTESKGELAGIPGGIATCNLLRIISQTFEHVRDNTKISFGYCTSCKRFWFTRTERVETSWQTVEKTRDLQQHQELTSSDFFGEEWCDELLRRMNE